MQDKDPRGKNIKMQVEITLKSLTVAIATMKGKKKMVLSFQEQNAYQPTYSKKFSFNNKN